MTTTEFSDQFDVLYNNITSNQAPGLNEYEKSVFLTKAQEELVKNYFLPQANPHQEGFDDNPKRQADFASLIQVATCTLVASPSSKFDQRAKVYTYPNNVFLVLNEQLWDATNNIPYTVVPISYEEYGRLMAKPYKFPPKYQAWRLITVGSTTPTVEIIGVFKVASPTYSVRFVKRPQPIRLTTFTSDYNLVTLGGASTEQGCELPEHLHEEILQRAVELAKIAWTGDAASTVTTGQRSE